MLAKQSPQMAFTLLAYLLDLEWLMEAHQRTRKDGAVGMDGVTAEEYERDLEGPIPIASRKRSVDAPPFEPTERPSTSRERFPGKV